VFCAEEKFKGDTVKSAVARQLDRTGVDPAIRKPQMDRQAEINGTIRAFPVPAL